jgi:AcrR family transcriptional regulator
MARTIPGVTRGRLLEEAIHLFATKGYAATSTADIQRACGLTAGSGALYKHFSSKKALLEEAVRAHLETMASRSREAVAPRADEDPQVAVTRLARVLWEAIEDERELIRLMCRDFDTCPELFEQMWRGVLAWVYHAGADWIRAQAELGTIEAPDPEASAAVLLASVSYYPILQALIGHTPGDLAPDRFLAAWVQYAATALTHPG